MKQESHDFSRVRFKDKRFEEYLKLDEVQKIEELLGVKLYWYKKLYMKIKFFTHKHSKLLKRRTLLESIRRY